MARSVSIVEYKVRQTHFFLSHIEGAGLDFFAAQCFTDAFVSAARSITFAMQALGEDIPRFKSWYIDKQEQLKADALAKFFNDYRVALTHIGDTVVRVASLGRDAVGQRQVRYYFMPIPDVASVPEVDIVSACSTYFKTLLAVVFESLKEFKYDLDDRWHYTAEHFHRQQKTIEDAEEELGFPRGWTNTGASDVEDERWRVLRDTQTVGCQINDLFAQYLGRSVEEPDDETQQ